MCVHIFEFALRTYMWWLCVHMFCVLAVNKGLVRQKWWIILLALFLYIHGSFLCYQIIDPAVAGLPDLLPHLCTVPMHICVRVLYVYIFANLSIHANKLSNHTNIQEQDTRIHKKLYLRIQLNKHNIM